MKDSSGGEARITVIGMATNFALFALKLVAGILGKSFALVADAFHSLSDTATDIVVLWSLKVSSRPPDANHRYGHKKIENLAELFIAVAIAAVAIRIAKGSIGGFFSKERHLPSWWVIFPLVVSIVAKEMLYHSTLRVGKKQSSLPVVANAWHHRTDSISSLVILVGILIMELFPSLYFLDAALGVAVAVFIIVLAAKIFLSGLKKLLDTSPPEEFYQAVEDFALGFPDILSVHKLRMRYLGSKIAADMHIQVQPDMSVYNAHKIASRLKHAILERFPSLCEVLIHIEPFSPRE
ncbi:cation-efflux pump [bacterium]|nr:MAG: cation-efflux pump [bacterium]